MRSVPDLNRSGKVVVAILFAVCLLAAWATELLSGATGGGISIWLPTAIVMVTALASRPARWPIWAGAAAAAEIVGNLLWYGHNWGPLLLIITGNLTAAFVGALLIRRIVSDRYILGNVRDAAGFLAVVIFVMPLISATLCSIALGWPYGRAALDVWPQVFLGNATGAVIAAPVVLLFFGMAARLPRLARWRQVEAGFLALFFTVLAAVSLGNFSPFVFIMLTPMLWAALRFRVPGAIVVSAALAIFASFLTAADISPFGATAFYGDHGLRGLQLFLLVAASTALLIGAMAEENREAMRRLNSSNRDLEDRDAERTVLLAQSETREREASRLITAIGEACPDLIFAKNLDYDLIYANGATIGALGLTRANNDSGALSPPIHAVASERDFIHQNDQYVLQSGKTLIVEEPLTLSSGEQRIYRATKAPLLNVDGAVEGLAGVCVDITDNKKAAARERILVREIEHRGRNLLAVLHSIVQLTTGNTVDEFRDAITRRLRALARTNGAIAAANWEGANFLTILQDEFLPYLETGDPRLTMTGGELLLDTELAQSLALVVHELATNAAKYGALSTAAGRLEIGWSVTAGDTMDRTVAFTWKETGGPRVATPTRSGFGSTVIKFFIQQYPGGRVDHIWAPQGLRVEIVLPLPQALAHDE